MGKNSFPIFDLVNAFNSYIETIMNHEELNRLQSRQLELLQIMSKSDVHAAKCQKLGLVFGSEYPDDLKEYDTANAEYNSNEIEITALNAAIAAEEPECIGIEEATK